MSRHYVKRGLYDPKANHAVRDFDNGLYDLDIHDRSYLAKDNFKHNGHSPYTIYLDDTQKRPKFHSQIKTKSGQSKSYAAIIFVTTISFMAIVGAGAALVILMTNLSDAVSNMTETTTTRSPSTMTESTTTVPVTSTEPEMTTTIITTTTTASSTAETSVAATSTTPIIETTTMSPIDVTNSNVTATSVTLIFNNVFPSLSPNALYSVFVATSPNYTLLNDSVTWASVQGLNPQPPYVAIYRCQNFFTQGSQCAVVTRAKRQVNSVSMTVAATIGSNSSCSANDINLYCNGQLQANTEFHIMYRAYDSGQQYDSSFAMVKTAIIGQWQPWQAWGACDVTCGGGIRRRVRVCQTGASCIGIASESQRCNTDLCPIQVTAGTWALWTAWTSCTVTCGGGKKVRTRECDKGQDNLPCVGSDSQNLDCDTWACPDCSITCTTGKRYSCAYCGCHGTFQGKVVSDTGQALGDVKITLQDVPFIALNISRTNGQFTLDKLCVGQHLVFQKSGYVSQTHVASWIPNQVTLQTQDSLAMDVNPTSKKRIVGDNALFCCSATGNPSFYEWFKDGVLIPNQSGSMLMLTGLTLASSGRYRCRANTEAKAVYSSEAALTVRTSADDFCPDTPESKFQELPEGCTVNGTSVYDVGECEDLRCRGNTLSNETCSEQQTYCCAGSQYQKIAIPCDGFDFTLYKVIRCGCFQCVDPVLEIQGFVFSAANNSAIEGINIYYNKTMQSKTDSNGQFYLSVPVGTKRASVTAKPDNISSYGDGTAVLELNDDADGVYYMVIRLTIAKVLDPIDSTNTSELMLTGESGSSLAEVILPANSFYDENGNLYQGMITPTVSTIDPRDELALQGSPGDFTTLDGEGELATLQTYGMLSISLSDESNNGLQIPGNVSIDIPEQVLGTLSDPADTNPSNALADIGLYRFNINTGSWEVVQIVSAAAARRRKRQTTFYRVDLPGVKVSREWYNFDKVTSTSCFSKVRVYENDLYKETQQKQRAEVFVYVKGSDNTHSLSQVRAINDRDSNGYCVVHRCDSPRNQGTKVGFRGYITAQLNGKFLIPAVNDTGLGALETTLNYQGKSDRLEVDFDLTAIPNKDGPFYDSDVNWRSSGKCVDAKITEPHFRFHLHSEDQCYQHSELTLKEKLTDECKPLYYKTWHSAVEHRTGSYTVCFVKILLPTFSSNIKVQAISKVGELSYTSNDLTISPGETYGFRRQCGQSGKACVEIKGPGPGGCSNDGQHDKQESFTLIDVSVKATANGVTTVYNVSEINSFLAQEYPVLQNGSTLSFQFKEKVTDFGIFCQSGNTEQLAVNEAKALCTRSADSIYAARFGEKPLDCSGDIVLILDTSGSMSSYLTRNKQLMAAIPDTFPIGSNNVLVSLMYVYSSTGSVIWGLSSSYTSSNVNLRNSLSNFPTDQANVSYIALADGLNIARTTVLPAGRSQAPDVVIMFWDGDYNLATQAASLWSTARVISVAPSTGNNANVRSIVQTLDDMIYLNANTTTDFVNKLRGILTC